MASEADFPDIDFAKLEGELFQSHFETVLKDGFKDDASVILDDLTKYPPRLRSRLGEAGLKILEKSYFDAHLARNLSITADRALTLNTVLDDVLIRGEELEGPLHATGRFTGLTFIQIAQLDFEPIMGMEIGEYQIISGDRPHQLSRRLLIPLLDIGAHQFD